MLSFKELYNAYNSRLESLNEMLAENTVLNRSIMRNQDKINDSVTRLDVVTGALTFLEKVASTRRGEMKDQIESILTEALQLLYGSNYHVEMNYSVKRNRSDMQIEVVKSTPQGDVRRNPIDGTGGGVSDALSVPLRLMILLGSRQTDKVAILDESYKHMDSERVELVANFLKVLSNRLGIQIIICSHHHQLQDKADKSIEVSESLGISKIKICD